MYCWMLYEVFLISNYDNIRTQYFSLLLGLTHLTRAWLKCLFQFFATVLHQLSCQSRSTYQCTVHMIDVLLCNWVQQLALLEELKAWQRWGLLSLLVKPCKLRVYGLLGQWTWQKEQTKSIRMLISGSNQKQPFEISNSHPGGVLRSEVRRRTLSDHRALPPCCNSDGEAGLSSAAVAVEVSESRQAAVACLLSSVAL